MGTLHTTRLRPYMLWLKNAFVLIIMLFCSALAHAQTTCNAGFTYTANNGLVTFTNTSTTSSGNPLLYYWSFGDNKESYIENPVHEYKSSGYYSVYLSIIDSLGGCRANFQDSIQVTGVCNADFYSSSRDLTAYFAPRTVETGLTHQWTFGDGTSSTNTYPEHAYATAGTYQVCQIINNSSANCSDTFCQQITVYDPVYCNSTFKSGIILRPNKYTAIFYNDTAYTGFNDATYLWNFGDNSTSTAKGYVDHEYNDTGVYIVSLTVTHYSCTSTSYDTIKIEEYISQPGNLSGIVYLDNSTMADAARVYLIKVDYSDTSLILVDTADIKIQDTLAMVTFYNLQAGTYYLKAALTTASAYYNDYIPTYGDTALMWFNADALMVDGNHMQQLIIMRSGVNPGGPGFIAGKVSQGANKKEGDPLKDIQVMLFNENGQPVAYTYSDIDGNFKFENLAFGTYKVHTEVPGLITSPGFASISAANPRVENIEVKVSSEGIVTSIFTRLSEEYISTPSLYPNPAKNALYFETELRRSQNTNIVIYNLTGQQVYSENVSLQQGKQTQVIAIDNLPAGLYMLSVKNALGTDEMRYKFVKADY